MEKTTTLNHIRIYPDGRVEGHFDLLTIVDGEVLKRARHIGVMAPGVSMADYLVGVNKSLSVDLEMPTLDADIQDRMNRIVKVEHTPDVVAAYEEAAVVKA